MTKAWQTKFSAENPTDYMKKNGVLLVSPSTCVQLATDTAQLDSIRQRVNEVVCSASWEMVFAENDAEFDILWDKMADNLDSLGFDKLYKADIEKYRVELDAK